MASGSLTSQSYSLSPPIDLCCILWWSGSPRGIPLSLHSLPRVSLQGLGLLPGPLLVKLQVHTMIQTVRSELGREFGYGCCCAALICPPLTLFFCPVMPPPCPCSSLVQWCGSGVQGIAIALRIAIALDSNFCFRGQKAENDTSG